jgi:hypothetical protein
MISSKGRFENGTLVRRQLVPNGKKCVVALTVADGRIRVAIDGRTVMYWSGSFDNLSESRNWTNPPTTPMFLGVDGNGWTIHELKLAPAPRATTGS